MARLSASTASCTFTAGLKPPFGIFITRAASSVVLARGSLSRFSFCRFDIRLARRSCRRWISGICLIAFSTRSGPLAGRPHPRRLLPGGQAGAGRGVVQQLLERVHLRRGLRPQPLQRGGAAEAGRPGGGRHPRPVLGDPLDLHQPLLDQHGEGVREQPVQRRRVFDAEVRQQVVVDGHAPAQPQERPRPLRRVAPPASSRADPMPRMQAYSHSATSSRGSVASRPPDPARALIGAWNADRSIARPPPRPPAPGARRDQVVRDSNFISTCDRSGTRSRTPGDEPPANGLGSALAMDTLIAPAP
jgi:hypothetical protein